MPKATVIKPAHKAIQAYYQTLKAYGDHCIDHETALRSAFQNLLAETAKAHRWMLVPEQRTKVGGKTVIPDGSRLEERSGKGPKGSFHWTGFPGRGAKKR